MIPRHKIRTSIVAMFLLFIAVSPVLAVPKGATLAGPVVVDDENLTFQDNFVTGTLADNDYDPDGDILTYSLVTGTPDGTIIINQNGTYTYTPNPLVYGIETIQYKACDPQGNCAFGILTMYVQFLNDAPQANDDILFAEMNIPRSGNAATNDFEPDAETPVYSVLVGPSHGTITLNSSGTFLYTPSAGYVGTDLVVYQACDPCTVCDQAQIQITVLASNNPPVANNSPGNALNEDSSWTGQLSTYTTDPENDPITYSIISQPAHGSVTVNAITGQVTYTPSPNYFGTDSFNYLACDYVGQCDPGTVGFNIAGINDPPTANNDPNFFGPEDQVMSSNVGSNDSDLESPSLTFSVVSGPYHGTFVFLANGVFNYTPAPNFHGYDSLLYKACDGQSLCDTAQANFFVSSVNDDPEPQDDEFTGPEDQMITGNLKANDIDQDLEPLYYHTTVNALHGTLTINTDGTFTYMPFANWYGTENIVYAACDSCGYCTPAFLVIYITEVPDSPQANDDSFTGNEDETISESVAGNDSDGDNMPLTYTSTSQPEHGTFNLNPNGQFAYTPDSNWNGLDTVAYSACSAPGNCDNAIVIFTVNTVNDLPVAQDGEFTTNEDVTLNNSIATLASDPVENSTIGFSIDTAPLHGTASVNSNGNIQYIPTAQFFGDDSFTYEACDAQGGCVIAEIIVHVNSVNDTPNAIDDENLTFEDTVLNGSLANATDADNDPLEYSIISNAMHGNFVLQMDGYYTYMPAPNYNGVDMITYSVCDNSGACDAATLILNVTPVNDAPVALNNTNAIESEALLNGTVANNDSDADNDPLIFSIVIGALHGTFSMNPNGTYQYTSESGFTGTESITYSVCDIEVDCASATLTINVSMGNTPPEALNDEFTTDEELSLEGDLSLNDNDNEGGELSYTILTYPAHGMIELNSDGTFVYYPTNNYSGSDSFTYQVCDPGSLCAVASVSVDVNEVNDSPESTNANIAIDEDSGALGNLNSLVSDYESSSFQFSIITNTQNGLLILSTGGTFEYTPLTNFNGSDSFVYEACDGGGLCSQATLFITVSPINDAPQATDDALAMYEDNVLSGDVSANDSDPDGGDVLAYTLTSTPTIGEIIFNEDGSFSYTPNANVHGTEIIFYTVCDQDGLCSTSTLQIQVLVQNDIPSANGEFYSTLEDQPISGTVAGNDLDSDLEVLTYSIVGQPENGSIIFNADGTFTFTPFLDVNGSQEVNYIVCDPQGACDSAILLIVITPVNDPPVAENDLVNLIEDTPKNSTVSSNDSNPDGDLLSYSTITEPLHGQIILNSDGTFSYSPDANFFGLDSMIYSVCDPTNLCVEAILTLDVSFINDLPVAVDETYTTIENTTVLGTVAGNDIEIDPEALTYSVLLNNSNGLFFLNPDGTFSYLPNDGAIGTFTVAYLACDPCGACDAGTLTFIVNPVVTENTVPLAASTSQQMCQMTSTSFDLNSLVSDNEQSDASLSITIDQPSNGNAAFNQITHQLNYTPAANYFGSLTITYHVCDNGTPQLCANGVIDLSVIESNSIFVTDVSVVDVACFGENTGSISINQIIGEGNYSYDWDNSQSTQNIDGLAPGTYTVVISSDQDCVVGGEYSFEVNGPDSALAVEVLGSTNINDQNNGTVLLNIQGGTPPYTVLWTGPNGFTSNDQNAIELTDAGNYTALISDNNGCSVEVTQSITSVESINTIAEIKTFPNPGNGKFTLQVSGFNTADTFCRIHDMSGKLIFSEKLNSLKSGAMDLSGCGKGIYILTISNANLVKTIPLIIE
jgi:large repetitive protein